MVNVTQTIVYVSIVHYYMLIKCMAVDCLRLRLVGCQFFCFFLHRLKALVLLPSILLYY